jgi:hypothetical protein
MKKLYRLGQQYKCFPAKEPGVCAPELANELNPEDYKNKKNFSWFLNTL